MVRRSKPWRVVFNEKGHFTEYEFGSEAKAYAAVNHERELIRDGLSRVSRAIVHEWDEARGRWMTFDRHDLVTEAAALPPKRPEDGS